MDGPGHKRPRHLPSLKNGVERTVAEPGTQQQSAAGKGAVMRRFGAASLLAAYGMTLALQGCAPIVVGKPSVSERRVVVVGILPGVGGSVAVYGEPTFSGSPGFWKRFGPLLIIVPAAVFANAVFFCVPTLREVWQPGDWPQRVTSDCLLNLVGYCKISWLPDPAVAAAWDKAQSDCFHSGTPGFDECMAARGFVRDGNSWVESGSLRR
jgi:hypothetical protein